MEDEKMIDFVRNRLEGDVIPSARRRSLAVAAVEGATASGNWSGWRLWWCAGSALAASLILAVLGFWGREGESREELLESVLVLLGSEVPADESDGGLDEALMAWQDSPYLELTAVDGYWQK